MSHPIYRVVSFEILAPYTLRVRFGDGTAQIIDFGPVLAGELYAPLAGLKLFNQVKVDPEVHTLVWPNGADFDPETLRDWPLQEQELRERARRWLQRRSVSAEFSKKRRSQTAATATVVTL
ncbi:MAG TPA: DUF2442 domain-containing protein [Terriglobia bacterium]|nr:DUF2442 domain-containing protein [Terriglobia bacterium]